MDSIKKLFEFLKKFPLWMRFVLIALMAIAACIFVSCGTPKTVATVQNVNPNSTVTVTMSVSNSNTSSPTIDTDLNPVE